MSDEALERITILLQARDRELQRSLDRSTRALQRATGQMEKRTKAFSAKATSDLKRAGDAAMGFGKAFTAGLAGGAIATVFGSINANLGGVVRSIAEVGDQARRSGLGAAAFQEWAFVAQQNRIGIDQLVDGFKELSLRSDEFIATGAGPAAEALARLGYTSSELAAKLTDPSALMLEMLGRMERLDKAAQIRVADELFGGTGGERFVELLAQGADGIDETIQRARELGLLLGDDVLAKATELDRKFGEVAARVDALYKRAVVGAFEAAEATARWRAEYPGLADAFDSLYAPLGVAGMVLDTIFVDAADDARDLTADVFSLANALSPVIGQAEALAAALEADAVGLQAMGLGERAAEMRRFADEIGLLISQFSSGAITAEDLAAGLEAVTGAASAAADEVASIDGVTMGGVIGQLGSLIGVLARVGAAARAAKAAMPGAAAGGGRGDGAAEMARRNLDGPGVFVADGSVPGVRPRPAPAELGFDDPTGSGRGASGGRVAASGFQSDVDKTRERIAELQAEAAILATVALGNRDLGDAMEYARKKADLLGAAQSEGREITPELAAEIDALAMSYMTAGLEAEAAAERIERIKDASEKGIDALTGLFDQVIVRGGSAKAAIASLLAEMAKVQFRNALLGASGGGGLFGFLGSLLLPRRAGGGSVSAGQPYLVNENTKNSEVFVPSRSGAILNVPQAQAALRGSTGAGGVVTIRVVEGEMFGARVRAQAQGVAVQVVQAGLQQYDSQALPGRVGQISANPRLRGG